MLSRQESWHRNYPQLMIPWAGYWSSKARQGKAERGLHYLRTAYARSSQDPEISYHIGVALYQLKRYDEAASELKQALKTNPEFNGNIDARLLLKKMGKE